MDGCAALPEVEGSRCASVTRQPSCQRSYCRIITVIRDTNHLVNGEDCTVSLSRTVISFNAHFLVRSAGTR